MKIHKQFKRLITIFKNKFKLNNLKIRESVLIKI